MRKPCVWLSSLLFICYIALFFLINLFTPDREYSAIENRSLRTEPRFSLSSLFSGRYAALYEEYYSDQFAFRDDWVSLKARLELISGKHSNNGIFLCRQETLIEPFATPDEYAINARIDAINALAGKSDAKIYFALIPTAAEIWRDLLPAGSPNDSQEATISVIYRNINAEPIDLTSVLRAHAAEPIFYRTDHHWTTLGAYYGYTAIIESMGQSSISLLHYTPEIVSNDFYGSNYSRSGLHWVAPDSITRYVRPEKERITNYSDGSPRAGSLYEEEYLLKKDKYSYFWGGNSPLIEIETCHEEAPTLLIIRDSFMDSLSPYLISHFSRISIVDLRYFKSDLDTLISEGAFQNILICYSVPNFFSDNNILLITD